MFGMDCKDYKAKLGLKKTEHLRNVLDEHQLEAIAKGEDFMANLMSSGIKDQAMLKNIMTNWWNNIKSNYNME